MMKKTKFDVDKQVAVVTGGNGLLGTEYVKTLAESGARVAVVDIAPKLNRELESLKEQGLLIDLYSCDIADKNELQNLLETVQDRWETPTILINNAAVDTPLEGDHGSRRFDTLPLEIWDKALSVNLTGVFICCQVFGSAMVKDKTIEGGSIINISSTYGIVSPQQHLYTYKEQKGEPFYEKPITYTVTKAGIIGMTKWLATYWAKKKVRVNVLAPGGVFDHQDSEFLEGYSSCTPMGRMAKKDEYNEAILFLSSNASSYMTGSVLVIDGGWTVW